MAVVSEIYCMLRLFFKESDSRLATMLWFDVTDLQRWHLPHLTGIQRSVVGVLSELLRQRDDVALFAFDEATGRLQEAAVESLPKIVRRNLEALRRADSDPAISVESYPPPFWQVRGAATSPPPPSDTPTQAPSPSLATRLRWRLGRFLTRTIGVEATDALRDFVKSGLRLLRVATRKFRFLASRIDRRAAEVVNNPAIIFDSVSDRSIVFHSGDLCLSLSASWGIHRYGQVIAENKERYHFKCISMIYDLIPTLYPQWLTEAASHVVTLWARQQIRNADVILTISKFQKMEIAKYIRDEKLPSPPIEVIRLGDNPIFFGSGKADHALPLPRYVPERKFTMFVSTLDVRKNQAILYQVWRRLAEDLGDQCPQLLLIGTPHLHVADLLYQMRHDRLTNRLIVVLTGITDEELAWYYKHCEFTLYPSVYEGWGLPISESLAVGKYCIAGNKTSLPEAGGDFVDYFDPLDVPGCYRLVRRAIEDPDYVKMRETNIRENYKPYTWKMTAQSVSEIVDECISAEIDKTSAPISPE